MYNMQLYTFKIFYRNIKVNLDLFQNVITLL